MSGDWPRLLSGDGPWLLSGDGPRLLYGDGPRLMSGDVPRLLSRDGPRLLSGDGPRLLFGYGPRLLSGDGPRLLPGVGPRLLSVDGPRLLPGDGPRLLYGDGPRLLSGDGPSRSLRGYLEPYVRVWWFGWTKAASHPARVRLQGMQRYSHLARTQHPQTLFTINKCCNKNFSSNTNMDNAIQSLAFLLNADDAMVIALQHLHVKEKNPSEKDVFVSKMLAINIV